MGGVRAFVRACNRSGLSSANVVASAIDIQLHLAKRQVISIIDARLLCFSDCERKAPSEDGLASEYGCFRYFLIVGL